MKLQSTPLGIIKAGYPLVKMVFLPRSPFRRQRERGSIAVMSAASIMLVLIMCGVSLELSRLYNRKVELSAIAKAVALAAAKELNGTSAGVSQAMLQASAVAQSFKYRYGNESFVWSDSAVKFSRFPAADGTWVDADTAKGSAANLFYVRVATSEFAHAGEVPIIFTGILSGNSTERISDIAIAGRTTVRAIPMAVCAMGGAAVERANTGSTGTSRELVQYGFRRGITYDLMRLNPEGTTPANFVIDPFLSPGMVSASSHTSAKAIRPFVCTGTMWMPHVTGGTIKIAQNFPLAEVFEQLNSRFNQYEGAQGDRCEPGGAPPDVNVMAYKFDLPLPWMSVQPKGQGVEESTDGGRLATMADLAAMPGEATPASYGPLWNYAKAVPYTAYSPSSAEPSSGYTTFPSTQWGNLYKPAPSATSYPASSPYMSGLTAHTVQPSLPNRSRAERYRRVLNVPLVSCPGAIGSASAEVLAVAKFFMTVPATKDNLYVEFAGIASQETLRGQVELFP
jgi:Flp pilus assembly protein TadG